LTPLARRGYRAGPFHEGAILRDRSLRDKQPSRKTLAVVAFLAALMGYVPMGCVRPAREATGSAPRVIASDPIDLSSVRPPVDLDTLTSTLADLADTLPREDLPSLETEIRDWLARLEFEDPVLLPLEETEPKRFFRRYRGRLLDVLGWSAFRRGDMRQAEAALTSAVEELNSRGTTAGYARHFFHLGELHAARGRWAQAAEAYLDAEVRGMGEAATPALERAWLRRYGSLRGLDAARGRELARVEDERRQQLVAGATRRPLPSFLWPRRTGPPLASAELVGRPLVLAVWGPDCSGCASYGARLTPLAASLAERGGRLVGVWLGADPAAAGPPLSYPLLVPLDPVNALQALGGAALPILLVVDARGRIRYRHAGGAAVPPPIDDIIVQIDHLRRLVP
jgi:hypothetical protein